VPRLNGAPGPGPVTLRARATDLAGRTQPEYAEWNRLGYGNNAIGKWRCKSSERGAVRRPETIAA
jgi:hypothetical protein